jgi:hypothetical protein
MGSISVQNVEGVTIVLLVVGYLLWVLVRRLRRSREDLRIGRPLAIGFLIRMAAIIGISASGLEATLRGGDETTFIDLGRFLASQPLGHGNLPHGPFQLHTDIFALQFKLGLPLGALRITQVGLATVGMVLILAAVYDLAGGRAARLAAWLLAFEPASIFFNSALHKEPLMELASGLVVFGGTRIWQRLDVRGILICALGGLIAVETRSYAGWFLVSAAVLLLLHASLRSLDRPLRAMPFVYAVVIAAFVVTPVLLQASSKKNLQQLQISQTANSTGVGLTATGSGPNSDNLALEEVNFSTRGQIIKNLPKRIRDLVLKPYPWQLGNTSQRIGAVGTLIAYALLLLLAWYGWQSRGSILARAAPLLYPLLLLLIAYSLSAGNAGTGFRYRSHLVTLAIGAMAILRERVLQARAARAVPAPAAPPVRKAPVRAPVTSPV